MERKYLWLGAAVAGAGLLGVGGWWVIFGRGDVTPQSDQQEITTEVEKVPTPVETTPEESEVVLDETKTSSGETFKAVSGTLVSVAGRTLVIESQGDRLQVEVAENASINRTILPDEPGAVPEVSEIALSQLEAGDKLDALVKIEGDKATATNVNVIVEPR